MIEALSAEVVDKKLTETMGELKEKDIDRIGI